MIIAIDGPAASGKSTVARALAQRLNLTFLDTGAMYRAVTLRVLLAGVDSDDGEACTRIAEAMDISFDENGYVLLDGKPGEPEVRGSEVTAAVSTVAAHAGVRAAIVPKQQSIAAAGGAVAEGRDTTTVVFPEADHKFFLIASPLERGRRRAQERGEPERAGEYAAEIERRDELDRTREHSPLRQASDASLVDTDGCTPEQVCERLLAHILGGA
ncbi:MAG TPA: (d)CMP kinase [Planctomycetes bacterium]|nr:(d)CMP kinase [Planctomycetota bacterium]HIK60206.1 (d)CMP kinase [Planctomycetota bacterium]